MNQPIVGFHRDAAGDWVAELASAGGDAGGSALELGAVLKRRKCDEGAPRDRVE